MNKIKNLLVVALAAFSVQAMVAKEETKKYPHAFFGLQGGGQTVLNGYNVGDVLTGTASLYGGAMWTPVLGTRLHLNAWESKEGIKNVAAYDFKYGTATVDLMVNLVSAINKRDDNAVDFYLIGGYGANKVWGNNWEAYATNLGIAERVHNHVTHCGKLGVLMDVNFSRRVALDFEIDAYRHGGHDYTYEVNMSKDWQLTGQIGLKFSFPGKAKKVKEQVYVNPVRTRTETPKTESKAEVPVTVPETPAKQVAKAEETAKVVTPKAPETMRKEIFYLISSCEADDANAQKIQEAAAWLKAHPTATATVDGYADKGTGNASINTRYALQRAQAVKTALVKAGVSAKRLTVKGYGDTVQPFGDNEKNRCVIIVATEK